MAWVEFGGLRGKGWAAALRMPVRLVRAIAQCLGVLRRTRPDVVLGMGGYLSVPGGLAAVLLRRRLVIHEQNCIAGLANRLLARFADRTLMAFPGALGGGIETGNPVRDAICALAPPAVRYRMRTGPLRLLVVGGSLGAQALNEVVPRALALIDPAIRPEVLHQAGEKHLEALQASYRAAGVQGRLVAFIGDMAAAYQDADLVICRAGATTVAELAAAGMPAILVPYPHAVDDHQSANARYLSGRQAAVLLPQAELTAERLAELLGAMDRPRLAVMAERALGLGRPDATERVARVCAGLAGVDLAADTPRGSAMS
jgi:UDP-N-acetylglucosamine--N-acetylmuramyl-(pentapeptide) pyrophosphoryl-undecaprenol N-acetylglucosamine transferase